VFEVFPFAYVFEKAGGAAINGQKRLLELSPKDHHDTTPCFFGSHYEINKVLDVYSKAL
jgi:fructose-1,6-bisphosphatase I